MSLKDCIARDADAVFLNTDEFCENLVLQIGTSKIPIIGSLQSNTVQNNNGNNLPLQSNAWTLYLKYPIEGANILSTGTRITIENKSFTIVSVSNEMGLATIQLQTHVGR